MNDFTIGFIMMTAAAIMGVIMTVRGWRTISRLSDGLRSAKESMANMASRLESQRSDARMWSDVSFTIMAALKGKAIVRDNPKAGCYEVWHVADDDNNSQVCTAVYPYNSDNPDDKEYKRIHTEEVAEKLNEKP